MPWQECRTMSLKREFVERASLEGAQVAPLCREYGISRETGHKWLKRFREQGYDGLEEQSRRPTITPYATATELVLAVLQAREAHPRWGPRKLLCLLRREYGEQTPSRATIARILERFGKVRERRRRSPTSIVEQAPHVVATASNDVWTIDFKGWWRTRDGARCEPLTVRDAFSRYVLSTKVMATPSMDPVWHEMERLFRRYGVPRAIQCDNGGPFVAVSSRGGLTRLSAWWLSLGIRLIRSRPGCPQDNGAHERMHRDMSEDVQAIPNDSPQGAQRALDRWRQEFNHIRPHDALDGKVPADVYRPQPQRSLRCHRHVYPSGWIVRSVYGKVGTISVRGCAYIVGRALIGHQVALEPLEGLRYGVRFGMADLGPIELCPSTADVARAAQPLLQPRKRRGAR
jgi:putative transposase